MVLDFDRVGAVRTAGHDVCVVGAGAAGLSLAVGLIRSGRRVLLLEGGRAGFDPASQRLYLGETDGLPFDGLSHGRCRVLGGTTTQWGGQVLEIDPHVFGPRAWLPGGEWPIAAGELEPHYARALELEGLTRACGDAAEIWRVLDPERPDFGADLVSAFSKWCPETNFWKRHGPELSGSPLCTIYTGANASELIRADDGSTLRAVRCRSFGGRSVDFEAAHFVLAMGAIETCRLLLQPTRDGSTSPWSRFGLVGRHFQEHICCTVATLETLQPQRARRWFDYAAVNGHRYHPKLKLSAATQARLQTLDVCGSVAVTTTGHDDLTYAFETYRLLRSRRLDELTSARLAHFARHLPALAWHKIPYAQRAQRGAQPMFKLVVSCEQTPLSAGRISLTTETDELGLFRPRVSWRASDVERRSIRSFIEVARGAFEAAGIGCVRSDPGVMDDDDALDALFRTSHHHLGGVRMAKAPAEGVVDPDLRIHGTANVFVCSSGVFPCAGFANPTHTIIALATRLAEHLAAARQRPHRVAHRLAPAGSV